MSGLKQNSYFISQKIVIGVVVLFLFIQTSMAFGVYVDPKTTFIDYNRYIDPKDPKFGTIEPSKYTDPKDPTAYIPFSSINQVRSTQGNIDFYSSDGTVSIIPDYKTSRINLMASIDINADVNALLFTGDVVGTANQVGVTNGTDRLYGPATLTISLPQDLNRGSNPTFNDINSHALNTVNITSTGSANFNEVDAVDFNASLGEVRTLIANYIEMQNGSLGGEIKSHRIIPSNDNMWPIGTSILRYSEGHFVDMIVYNLLTAPTVTATTGNFTNLPGYVKDAIFNAAFPVSDANIPNNITVDWNGLQNYPTGCPAGQAVQVIGDTLSCISVSSTGTGRTYTSGTPATIEVNNDLNTISQNFDGNFTSRFKPAFDTNFAKSFDSNFIKSFDSNFQKSFDGNFNTKFKTSFDGNFQLAFDGNYYARNALLFPVPDANILNAAAYKANCDNNTACTITGTINTTIDANFNNINFDGNIIAKDANSYIGAPSGAGNNDIIFTGFNYTAHPGNGGVNLNVDAETYVFASSAAPTTGQYFSNTNKASELHTAGVAVSQDFFSSSLRDGSWWKVPRATNPSGAPQNKDAMQFIKDFQNPFDSNQPYIKRNGIYESLFAKITTGTPGDGISDMNLTSDINAKGNIDLNGSIAVKNDSNFLGQIKVTSCVYIGATSLCPNQDSNGGLVITG